MTDTKIDSLPVLARAELLERVDGDLDFLNELALDFKKSFQNQLPALRTNIAERNDQVIQGISHSLKGALRNLGGTRSSAVAGELESIAKLGRALPSEEILHRLELAVAEFELELAAVCRTKSS